MKLNAKKSKVMPFNFSRKWDFVPNLEMGNEPLEVVFLTKLLGVIITSDCKFSENTKYLTKKGYNKLWFLRRLKNLGASQATLINVYKLFVRQTLEFCAPLWSGAIKKSDRNALERVQRVATLIIANDVTLSYTERLGQLMLDRLGPWRSTLTKKCSIKMAANLKHKYLLPKNKEGRPGTRNHTKYHTVRQTGSNPVQFLNLLKF